MILSMERWRGRGVCQLGVEDGGRSRQWNVEGGGGVCQLGVEEGGRSWQWNIGGGGGVCQLGVGRVVTECVS